MEAVHGVLDRARVILTQAVTYIMLATGIITTGLATVVPLLPDNIAAQVAGYGATVLAFLLGAAAVIRRVTPVDRDDRGVLAQ